MILIAKRGKMVGVDWLLEKHRFLESDWHRTDNYSDTQIGHDDQLKRIRFFFFFFNKDGVDHKFRREVSKLLRII